MRREYAAVVIAALTMPSSAVCEMLLSGPARLDENDHAWAPMLALLTHLDFCCIRNMYLNLLTERKEIINLSSAHNDKNQLTSYDKWEIDIEIWSIVCRNNIYEEAWLYVVRWYSLPWIVWQIYYNSIVSVREKCFSVLPVKRNSISEMLVVNVPILDDVSITSMALNRIMALPMCNILTNRRPSMTSIWNQRIRRTRAYYIIISQIGRRPFNPKYGNAMCSEMCRSDKTIITWHIWSRSNVVK